MREVTDLEDLSRLAGDNLLCQWTAQGFAERRGGVARAWATDDDGAVAVACPGLATKDRIAVCGSLAAAAGLIGLVLTEVGPSFRPIGEPTLIRQMSEMIELPEGHSLEVKAPFGWMIAELPLITPPPMPSGSTMIGSVRSTTCWTGHMLTAMGARLIRRSNAGQGSWMITGG